MRKAIVYCHDTEAGFLEESTPGRGYTFTYDKQYMMDRTHDPVSLTMPFREEPYQSDYLFPVFTNMLPEGANRKIVCRSWAEVLRLAEQAYIRTGAWGSLLDIIPSMAKADVGDDEHRDELQRLAWIGLMDQARADLGSDGLKTWWKNQSRKTRQQVPLQVAMAEHLIECDDHDTAQEILLDGLKRQYDDRLVMVIPRLKTNNPEQIEKMLRQQIKAVGDRPLLWSTLGQSLMKHGEWQEASLAFRAALKQRPDAFDYAWLADSLDKQHKPEEAAAMRRDGLLLTLQNNGSQQ